VVFGIGMWAYDQGDLNTERLSKWMGLPFQGKATMLRSVAPIFLLLASISAPAAAMDPSAMEETNCLMACDANQENCGAGQVSQNKSQSLATSFSQRKTNSSPVPASHRTTGLLTAHERTPSQPSDGKR
jgi:hypothetical protein